MKARRRDERGAVAVFTAAIMVVLLGISALAVDLGMQRVTRRDAQALADVVALDLSRMVGTRTTDQIKNGFGNQPTLSAALSQSLTRNRVSVTGNAPDLDVKVYLVTLLARNRYTTTAAGVPVETPGTSKPTGVVVVATTTVDFGFAPAIGFSRGGVRTAAVGSVQGDACYRVGSFALGLASKDSVLRALLGQTASVRVLSSSGIANANVSLLGIATVLGVGTPQDLVNAPNVTVGQFLSAAATVLNDQGDTASANLATQLLGLKGDLGTLANATAPLSRLIDLGQGGGAALTAGVNVLDIVTGSVIVADGGNAIRINDLEVNTGLTNARVNLYLTEPARQGCNGGVAKSSQGYVEITGDVGLCPALCTTLTVRLSLANASAKQSPSWVCNTDSLKLSVFDQTLATVRLTATVKLVGISVASVDTGAPGQGPTKDYDLPLPPSYTPPGVETSPGELGLRVGSTDVTLLGLKLTPVSAVLSLLDGPLTTLGELISQTLLPSLGLTLDGADLTAVDPVSCASPKLVG